MDDVDGYMRLFQSQKSLMKGKTMKGMCVMSRVLVEETDDYF